MGLWNTIKKGVSAVGLGGLLMSSAACDKQPTRHPDAVQPAEATRHQVKKTVAPPPASTPKAERTQLSSLFTPEKADPLLPAQSSPKPPAELRPVSSKSSAPPPVTTKPTPPPLPPKKASAGAKPKPAPTFKAPPTKAAVSQPRAYQGPLEVPRPEGYYAQIGAEVRAVLRDDYKPTVAQIDDGSLELSDDDIEWMPTSPTPPKAPAPKAKKSTPPPAPKVAAKPASKPSSTATPAHTATPPVVINQPTPTPTNADDDFAAFVEGVGAELPTPVAAGSLALSQTDADWVELVDNWKEEPVCTADPSSISSDTDAEWCAMVDHWEEDDDNNLPLAAVAGVSSETSLPPTPTTPKPPAVEKGKWAEIAGFLNRNREIIALLLLGLALASIMRKKMKEAEIIASVNDVDSEAFLRMVEMKRRENSEEPAVTSGTVPDSIKELLVEDALYFKAEDMEVSLIEISPSEPYRRPLEGVDMSSIPEIAKLDPAISELETILKEFQAVNPSLARRAIKLEGEAKILEFLRAIKSGPSSATATNPSMVLKDVLADAHRANLLRAIELISASIEELKVKVNLEQQEYSSKAARRAQTGITDDLEAIAAHAKRFWNEDSLLEPPVQPSPITFSKPRLPIASLESERQFQERLLMQKSELHRQLEQKEQELAGLIRTLKRQKDAFKVELGKPRGRVSTLYSDKLSEAWSHLAIRKSLGHGSTGIGPLFIALSLDKIPLDKSARLENINWQESTEPQADNLAPKKLVEFFEQGRESAMSGESSIASLRRQNDSLRQIIQSYEEAIQNISEAIKVAEGGVGTISGLHTDYLSIGRTWDVVKETLEDAEFNQGMFEEYFNACEQELQARIKSGDYKAYLDLVRAIESYHQAYVFRGIGGYFTEVNTDLTTYADASNLEHRLKQASDELGMVLSKEGMQILQPAIEGISAKYLEWFYHLEDTLKKLIHFDKEIDNARNHLERLKRDVEQWIQSLGSIPASNSVKGAPEPIKLSIVANRSS